MLFVVVRINECLGRIPCNIEQRSQMLRRRLVVPVHILLSKGTPEDAYSDSGSFQMFEHDEHGDAPYSHVYQWSLRRSHSELSLSATSY